MTEQQLMVINLLPEEYHYLAMDKAGDVFAYGQKPIKFDIAGIWVEYYKPPYAYSLVSFNLLFKDLLSWDEEPLCIDEFRKEKKQ